MLSQQLRIFLQAAQCGSFSKAAEQLYVTPSSVLKHMNTLEARLGATLFLRDNQGVRLTEAGQVLYDSGRQLAVLAEDALFRLKNAAREEKYVLRLGSSLCSPSKVLTDLWEPLRSQHRAFQFTVVPYDDDRAHLPALAASLGREIDLLVGAFSARRILDAAQFLPLGRYPLCVAVPADHPLARCACIQVQALYGERLLVGAGGDVEPIDRFRAALRREHPQIQVTDTQCFYDIDIFNLCEQTGALLLTLEPWAALHPLLVTRTVDWGYTVPYGVLYAKEPSPAVAEFIEILRERYGLPQG